MRIITVFFVNRLRSFAFAGKGLWTMLREEHNAWLHCLATVIVLAAGLHCGLTSYEWCWIVLAVVSVWTAEAINTAFECLADVASPNFHPMVEKAKDVAAAAVLITSVGALVIGILIFGPYLLDCFDGSFDLFRG